MNFSITCGFAGKLPARRGPASRSGRAGPRRFCAGSSVSPQPPRAAASAAAWRIERASCCAYPSSSRKRPRRPSAKSASMYSGHTQIADSISVNTYSPSSIGSWPSTRRPAAPASATRMKPAVAHASASSRQRRTQAIASMLDRVLRHQRELAHPPRVQPLDPQPVGGEQVVQRAAADLRGDGRGVRGERVRQRLRRRAVRAAVVLLPGDDEPGPLQAPRRARRAG